MRSSTRKVTVLLALAFLTLALSPATASEPTYYGATAQARQTSDVEMRTKRFDDQLLTATANFGAILDQTMVECTFHATNRGEPVKGARGILTGLLAELGPDGNVLQQMLLPSRRVKTGRDGWDSTFWDLADFDMSFESLAPDTYYAIQVQNNLGSGKQITEAETNCRLATHQSCVTGPTTLCLSDDRFKVEVDFGNNPGQVFRQQGDEGVFFFNDTDVRVELINGCGLSGPGTNHFWVFYAATTNVEFEITVEDTKHGQVRAYVNPDLGTAPPTITDTAAFATCP